MQLLKKNSLLIVVLNKTVCTNIISIEIHIFLEKL